MQYPQRIVCLTDETTEWLYLLEQQHRIVGISGFTVRPPQARKEKPRVSAFTSAKIGKILDLKPDLVLAYSDLQADIVASLVREGLNVHVFNQRSVDEIFASMHLLAAMVGCAEQGNKLIAEIKQTISDIQHRSESYKKKPRVYFEEWDDPVISGIAWVSELIGLAGGVDCFAELGCEPLAKNRIIADHQRIIDKQPDIIIGSWCGKKFRPERVAERPGWQDIPAVKNHYVYEIKSAYILQPGPASLTEGLNQLHQIIDGWAKDQTA